MKKLIILLSILLGLCGCTKEEPIQTIYNAGLDVTNINYTNIKFNIYHTVEGNWTLLHTFNVCPKKGNYIAVVYTCDEDLTEDIVFNLQETTIYEKNDIQALDYDSIIIDSYTYHISGNTETGFSYYQTELMNNTEEQYYQVYAIGGNQFNTMKGKTIHDPYGTTPDNLDNILITFTLEK